jgi:hypothetical protein
MNKWVTVVLVSLTLLIPVVLYFWVWEYYALNIPKWDDHALKAFLVEYLQAENWSDKLYALFRQHNEHRITFTRFIALLDYSLFGELNYKRLMLFGNLLLLGVPVLWWVLLHFNQKPLYTLIPVPFIWLTLSHYENMYWGMASVQNFGVVTLALWTFYLCVSRQRGPFIISIILAGLALLTSGNGLLVLPVGAVLLFLAPRWKRLIVWLLISGLYLTAYFYHFEKSPATPGSEFGPGVFLKGFMYFLGSFAEALPVQNHQQICLIFGIILFLVALSIVSTTLFRIVRNRYETDFAKNTDLFCLGALLFILGSALIVVYSRVGFGLEGLLTSRYKIYSFLLLLVAYLYVVIPIRGSFLSPYVSGIVFLNALFAVFSYHYHLVDASNLRKFQTTQRFNWTYMDRSLQPYRDTTLAGRLVEDTPVFYDSWLPMIQKAAQIGHAGTPTGMNQLLAETKLEQDEKAIHISNARFVSQRLQDSGVYIILVSAKRYYLFPTYRQRNANRKQLFLDQAYFSPGFSYDIPYSELQKDTYAWGIVWQHGKSVGIQMSNDSIRSRHGNAQSIRTNW